jgi:hypothetical protein
VGSIRWANLPMAFVRTTEGGNVTRSFGSIALALALCASACAAGEVGGSEPPETTTATTIATVTDPGDPSDAPSTTVTDTTPSTVAEAEEEATSEFHDLMAAMATAPVVSARIEGTTEIFGLDTGAGITDASITFTTAFDADTGDGSILIDLSSFATVVDTGADPDDPFAGFAADMAGPMEVRKVGDRAYARVPLFGALFGVDTEWLSMPADDGQDFSSGFEVVPTDPSEVLETYEGADATVVDLGTETVNGVGATHYLVTFDTAAMFARMSAEDRAHLEASGILAHGVVPLDLWISDAGHLVRMILEIDGSTIESPEGEGFEAMVVRYDAFDINGEVRIEAPPASDVTDVESLELGDMGFDIDG